jgi:hypothetical protein
VRKSFAIFGLGAAMLLPAWSALADDAASKPHIGNGPAVERSVPSSAPAATTTQMTGATNQDKTVKSMNNNEKAKIDANGK